MSENDETAPAPAAPDQAGDPAAEAILTLIAALAPGKSVTPEAVARAIAQERAKPSDPPDAWRRYLKPVKQQALNLARRGRIVILRKGKPVDPRVPVKGVIRLAAAPAGD